MGKLETASKNTNIPLELCFPIIPCNWDLRTISLGASNITLACNRLISCSHTTHRQNQQESSLSPNSSLVKQRSKTTNLSWMSSFPTDNSSASGPHVLPTLQFPSGACSDSRCVTRLPRATTSHQPLYFCGNSPERLRNKSIIPN